MNEIIQFPSQKLNLPEDVVRSAAGVGPDAINQLAANVPALQTFLGGEK
jgi:hypothetical protein